MEEIESYLIVGMYVLLVLCLFFFFVLGKRIQQMGARIENFEAINQKELENVKTQVGELKENIEKTMGPGK